MHSFDDDMELDQITRSAADAYQAPSAANWEKMQRVLDKEMPQQKKRRGGIIWWIFPGLLVLGIAMFWLRPTQKQIEKQDTTQKEQIQPSKLKELKNEPIILQHQIDPVIVKQNKTVQLDLFNEPINDKKELQKSAQALSNTTNNSPLNNQVIATTEQHQTNENNSINNSIATSVSVESAKAVEATNITNEVSSSANANNTITLKPKSKKGFFIGITGGFDESTVKYSYASNSGYNLGGELGYRINDRWSIQTGAIYTQKKYKLNGADFHPPKGSWVSYLNIETVEGYCKMWDIPIMATYHFKGNENGNGFVSLGTSSYFMKNENYDYLINYNNQAYTRNSNYNSTDQHLFALLHISAGIEKPIGKNITTIIEPYAKLPLSGVGFGNIQLSSFGLNFSVQYRQPKN